MNDPTPPTARRFQQDIYMDVDARLRASGWNSGAAEAHGLLAGLACRGIDVARIGEVARLFQLTSETELDIFSGLFEIILRDLRSSGFVFDLMLPDDDSPLLLRLEAIANWCGGFVQGFYHDGEIVPADLPPEVREAIADITEISSLDVDPEPGPHMERELAEITEFLRVATQLVYEELNPDAAMLDPAGSNDIN